MTVPVDINDPKLAKAYAHPLRIEILTLLDDRVASPKEIAHELGTPLSNTSYHVRQLVSLGFLELVGRTAKRGAIEHHYTARVRPTITDEGWAKLPAIVKRAIAGGNVQRTINRVVAATEEGGFDRDDAHHSHTAGRLDDKGWTELSSEMAGWLERAERIVEESEARLQEDGDAAGKAIETTVVLMQFEGPKKKPGKRRKPARAKRGGLQIQEKAPVAR
ncbi:MAG TPA: helix-turn-helix domain-containing protein [Thermoleophilaceae bacterium]|nr:helix-turn-helix domain-containing protein [Thermoleophilaceae bacterium]